jgi:hypothetical protein
MQPLVAARSEYLDAGFHFCSGLGEVHLVCFEGSAYMLANVVCGVNAQVADAGASLLRSAVPFYTRSSAFVLKSGGNNWSASFWTSIEHLFIYWV